tara:strand:+ start:1181 stop:1855 length:675 start_codon:yes stop_codon:yes gene_type:complete
MVYKIIQRIIIFYFFSLIPMNLYSNIIYDKNNIIITEIDLGYYNQIYFDNYGEIQNKSAAIKDIVVIKKLINNFKTKNPLFLKKIDETLEKEFDSEMMDISIVKDFIRYFKIKNEFIFQFYNTNFNINDLKNIFDSFEKIELPISKNNCLTFLRQVDLKGNINFLNNFYLNLRKEEKKYEVDIDNEIYDVCIDSRIDKVFEQNILNYIDLKTADDFKKFVYEQQ